MGQHVVLVAAGWWGGCCPGVCCWACCCLWLPWFLLLGLWSYADHYDVATITILITLVSYHFGVVCGIVGTAKWCKLLSKSLCLLCCLCCSAETSALVLILRPTTTTNWSLKLLGCWVAGLLGCWCFFFNTNILELELGVLLVISDDEWWWSWKLVFTDHHTASPYYSCCHTSVQGT